MFNVNGLLCSVALMPALVPGGEAERVALNAAFHYFRWDAVGAARQHQAHLLVAVLPLGDGAPSTIEVMSLYSKLVCTCLADDNTLGVYTSGTIFAPAFYRDACNALRHGALPVMAWIFIGMHHLLNEDGSNAYTIGLEQFNKMELEILASRHEPNELFTFLCSICDYLIANDITLRDGETIGFSEDEKLAITRSPRVAGVAEETLKIAY
ncbi:hypothetical protein HMPREF9080_02778 [Cardiobacterium valvarum F0432]|uniref:DUF4261 domain-containing protein n=2 Tax=Cardiobacterium valvarum TaxID=194702 RepID=G9ZJ09_9GAMM|nr:hypothetical protein HMPREF9080_02778 [Cardiobacterium valvarum F0432]